MKQNYQKSLPDKKSNYAIEFRLDGVTGFLLCKKRLDTFEDAQRERDLLIRMGATEALIKKQNYE